MTSSSQKLKIVTLFKTPMKFKKNILKCMSLPDFKLKQVFFSFEREQY